MCNIDITGVCIKCGTEENLSAHHVVPQKYLRHFENRHYSQYNSFFIVKLCRDCHDQYEEQAERLVQSIHDRFLTNEEKLISTKLHFLKTFKYTTNKKTRAGIAKGYFKKFNTNIQDEDIDLNYNPYKIIVERIKEKNITRIWINHFLSFSKYPYISIDQKLIYYGDWENIFDKQLKLKTK